jgi:hypothetical protein
MLQSLLLILLIILSFWSYARLKRVPPEERRRLIYKFGAGALVLLLLLLAATGRLHWLYALIGALLPFVRGILGMAMQLLPLWLQRRAKNSQSDTQQTHASPPPPPASDMSVQEAINILGLSGDLNSGEITAESVTKAHKRLIQKLHPDRGGNDYLAAKINQARDVLLKALGK